jgi:hypothetical protein
MSVRKSRTLADRQAKREAEREAERQANRWGPDVLYRGRLMERRIMLLELMAQAIERVETFPSREEAEAFFKELRATRERTWGARPWKGVKDEETGELDDERFRRHVLDIAETFANAESVKEAWYPHRAHQLEGAEYPEPESG